MHKKPPNELRCRDGHHLPAVTILVIPPFERDLAILQLQDAVVGDGNTVGVSAQIFHQTRGILEGWLAVNHPLLAVAAIQQAAPVGRILQRFQLTVERELCMSQRIKKLATKQPRKHLGIKNFLREALHLPRPSTPPPGMIQWRCGW